MSDQHEWVGSPSSAAYCARCGKDYRDQPRECKPVVSASTASGVRPTRGFIIECCAVLERELGAAGAVLAKHARSERERLQIALDHAVTRDHAHSPSACADCACIEIEVTK